MNRRRAFTLIELLVVIGILLILIGMVGYGLSKVMGGSKVSATKVRLEALRSMVAELEAATKGLNRPIGKMYDGSGTSLGSKQYWWDGDPNDGKTVPEPDPFPAPVGLVVREGSGVTPPPRYDADAVLNTQQIIGLLQQVPNARKGLEQMPASEMMEPLAAGLGAVKLMVNSPPVQYGGTANSIPNPPIPLDAWNNPIIMLPGGGMDGVRMGFKGGDVNVAANYDVPNHTVKARDQRPFWASAGPDGSFQNGDDNVYSFEN